MTAAGNTAEGEDPAKMKTRRWGGRRWARMQGPMGRRFLQGWPYPPRTISWEWRGAINGVARHNR